MTHPLLHSHSSEELGREAQRLRKLARGLLYDRHGSEDVVQEAWLAALRAARPPRGGSLGAWLAGTVKNLARQRTRAEARRARREERAARPERIEATDEAGARIELLRRMFDALDELDEPYRTAVVLQYLDGLRPREIAKRLGLPVNTVRTHVRRGLDRLRARLDADGEDGRASLLAALVPLAGAPPFGAPLPGPEGSTPLGHLGHGPGAILMSKKFAAVAVAALVLVLASTSPLWWNGDPGVRPDPVDTSALTPPASPAASAAEDEAPTTGKTGDEAPRAATRTEVVDIVDDWVIRGRAVDGEGAPFPGLEVVIRLLDGYDESAPLLREEHTVTDAAGGFAFPTTPPARTVFVVAAGVGAEILCYEQSVLALAGEAAPTNLVLTVYPLDVTITGRVLDPAHEPFAGARLEALGREAVTNAAGSYSLRTTSHRANTRIRVYAAGHARLEMSRTLLRPGHVVAEDIVLSPELVLHGRVVDEDDHPLAGARVASDIFDGEATETDAQGKFALGGYDPEKDWTSLYVNLAGYAQARWHGDPADLPAELEITMARAGRLTGRIVDHAGHPVEAALVCVGNPPNVFPQESAWSTADGSFTVESLPPTELPVFITRAGFASFEGTVHPAGDPPSAHLEVELRVGHTLGGVVLDEAGAPIAGAMIYAEPGDGGAGDGVAQTASTDAEGRFLLSDLQDIRYRLGILEDGYARLEVEDVTIDRTDHVFQLRRGGELAGRAVDGETGEPIRAFEVRLVEPLLEEGEQRLWGYRSSWTTGVAFADTEGYFATDEDDLEADHVVGVEVRAEGYAPAVAPRVFTAPNPDPDELVLRLFRGVAVHGVVVDRETSAPIAGARVLRVTERVPLSDAASPYVEVLETTTDAAGAFTLEGVPAGPMSLGVLHDDWMTALDGPFEVPVAGAPVRRTIAMSRGATITIRVLDPHGEPLAGAGVAMFPVDRDRQTQDDWNGVTDREGRHSFVHLPAGSYQVSWTKRAGSSTLNLLSGEVRVGDEEEAEVVLQPHGTATVEGTVSFADGRAIPANLYVMLVAQEVASEEAPEPKPPTRAEFLQDGRFTVEFVEPGAYRVSCYHHGGREQNYWYGEATVKVEAGGRNTVSLLLEPH